MAYRSFTHVPKVRRTAFGVTRLRQVPYMELSAAYHRDLTFAFGCRHGHPLGTAGFLIFLARAGEPWRKRRGRRIGLRGDSRGTVYGNRRARIVRHSDVARVIIGRGGVDPARNKRAMVTPR